MKIRGERVGKIWLLFLVMLSIYIFSEIVKSNLKENEAASIKMNSIKVETMEISAIKRIEVQCKMENVNILFTDELQEKKVKVVEKSQKMLAEELQYKLVRQEDLLTILGTSENDELNDNVLEIDLEIPASYKNSLVITDSLGSIIMTGNCMLNDLTINQEVGNMKSKGELRVNRFELNNLMGSCHINSLYAKEYVLASENGNLEVHNLSGVGQVNNLNGKISVSYRELVGDSSVKSSTSNININLANSFTGLINADSKFGQVKSDLDFESTGNSGTEKQVMVGEGSNTLTINTSSGDIKIDKTK